MRPTPPTVRAFHGAACVVRASCLKLAVLLVLAPGVARAQQADRWDQRWENAWDPGYFQAAPPCSFDLRAAHHLRPEGEEWSAFASFQMPLSSCRSSSLSTQAQLSASSSSDEPLLEGEEERPEAVGSFGPLPGVGAPSGGGQIAAPYAEPEPAAAVLQFILEPLFVRQVVSQALRASGLDQVEREMRELAARARFSGLLPELRLRGAMGLDQSTSLVNGGYPGEATLRGGSDSAGEVRLTFRLNRLLFDDIEPGLERLRLQLIQARQKVTETALELLLDWNRARQKSVNPDLTEEERLSAALDAVAAELRLDVLTGGWFLAQRPGPQPPADAAPATSQAQ